LVVPFYFQDGTNGIIYVDPRLMIFDYAILFDYAAFETTIKRGDETVPLQIEGDILTSAESMLFHL